MSTIFLAAYILFIPVFFKTAATSYRKRQWKFLTVCMLLLAGYVIAVFLGLFVGAGARHASDDSLREAAFIVLAALGVCWLVLLFIFYLVRKAEDRSIEIESDDS